jgi:hypothetical protein
MNDAWARRRWTDGRVIRALLRIIDLNQISSLVDVKMKSPVVYPATAAIWKGVGQGRLLHYH